MEQYIIYGVVGALCLIILAIYLRKLSKETARVNAKIHKAQEFGLYEPVSLHPFIDADHCIGSGACVKACPETDILGIRNGIGTTINASQCVGHGACFHACPVQAISLRIGTEKRGIDLPHVSQNFESNVPGIFIAGEMGGMGLIKNSVEQGRQAIENIAEYIPKARQAQYDVIIVGAGPAGISASLTAKKLQLTALTLEQDTLGGTVYTFPRSKIVMTAPMDLPLHGKVKLFETSKSELLELWHKVLENNNISIRENSKVEYIINEGGLFEVGTKNGERYTASSVLLAIGRRGTPRKLGVPGENLEKVAYRLLEPDHIQNKRILVVGGGDSAIESALLLAENNQVTLSYRGDVFNRLKPKNQEKISSAQESGQVQLKFNTQVLEIAPEFIRILDTQAGETFELPNDLIYIFAGGELPTEFLQKVGIQITKRFNYTLLSHQNT